MVMAMVSYRTQIEPLPYILHSVRRHHLRNLGLSSRLIQWDLMKCCHLVFLLLIVLMDAVLLYCPVPISVCTYGSKSNTI